MDHQVINAFIAACVVLVVGALGFSVTRWVTHVDQLHTSMDDLKEAIFELRTTFVTQEQHRLDLELIRSSKSCTDPKCPFDNQPNPKGA